MSAASVSSVVGGAMGEQQFLQLLVAQLKNQDPLSPMDNSQFVSQLAQFSALQQEQSNGETQKSLLSSNQHLLAETLVGRNVGFTLNGHAVTDEVLGASVTSDGVQLLLQSGASIPLSSVTSTY